MIVAVTLFANVALPVPVYQAAVGAFGLSVICLVLALFVNPLPSCGGGCNSGHGFGYWLALIVALVGLGLSVMRMRESDTSRTTNA